MGEMPLFSFELVLLYYVLVVLVVLIKSKVLEKFLKLFLCYMFMVYTTICIYDKKKIKNKIKNLVFLLE